MLRGAQPADIASRCRLRTEDGKFKLTLSLKSLACAVACVLLGASSAIGPPGTLTDAAGGRGFDGTLVVLTYNVKGLPWPIARGRAAAISSITGRLRGLRRERLGPQIVVLQEAFTEDARAIGRAAGYRYVVDGPAASDASDAPMDAQDRQFLADAHWWAGETEGRLTGSGLQILSDYPIVAVHRMAYPAFACAGYDCLANKGVLLARVQVPGASSPIDIVTTHLNSRNSSGVSDERSLHAYRRQFALLSAFINRWHDPSIPLIAAGDFNVGSALPRQSVLRAEIASWRVGGTVRDALQQIATGRGIEALQLSQDALWTLRRARDLQLFAPGTRSHLRLIGVRVPFGRDPTGAMLSDHVGYASLFRLDRS